MATIITREVVGGKAILNGRPLAEWLPEVVDLIVERFSPEMVISFGSVAGGTDGPDSDIDVLVVFSDLPGRHHDVATSILQALDDLPVPVDVMVTDQGEIASKGSLPGMLRVAMREGRVVYSRSD